MVPSRVQGLPDPAAPEETALGVVEYGGLARRDGPLGLVKDDEGVLTVRARMDDRRGVLMAVPDAGQDP